jgi:hypothetical protein
MAKSKFSTRKKPKRKRTPKPRTGGGRGNAWRKYVASSGGGRYVPSNEPIPD